MFFTMLDYKFKIRKSLHSVSNTKYVKTVIVSQTNVLQ